MTALIDLTGQRFGRLVVLRRESHAGRRAWWCCQCDCGVTHVTMGDYLRSGKTRSCGCLQRELVAARKTTHGATRRKARWPEWGIWRAMINRCYRPKTEAYRNYGARGITVCDRWRFGEDGATGFECFVADIGRRPSPELSIERNDNNGNYEPGNCRWATAAEQRANQRSIERKPYNQQELAA